MPRLSRIIWWWAWSAVFHLIYVRTVGADICNGLKLDLTPAMIRRVMKPLCSGLVIGAGGLSRLWFTVYKQSPGSDGKGYYDRCSVLSFACQTGLWPCCICMFTLLLSQGTYGVDPG